MVKLVRVRRVADNKQDGEGGSAAAVQPRLGSVLDAVVTAQERFKGTLVFLEQAVKSAGRSPFRSPEEVWDLFEALDGLVRRWRDRGRLGTTWKRALSELGFDYKHAVSPTATQDKFIGDYRFWYDGEWRIFGQHVTFGTGQDPQTCLSVHWWRDDENECLIIGWCGKHGRNTRT